jgi:hypothetical protein
MEHSFGVGGWLRTAMASVLVIDDEDAVTRAVTKDGDGGGEG